MFVNHFSTRSVLGSPQKPSSATIRTVRRHLYFVRREHQALIGRASPSMMWGNPPPRPHPRKRRFAQGRPDSTAVQIPSRDFLGLSNYKALTLKFRFLSVHFT